MLTIPILVDGAEMLQESSLPPSIRGLARRNALVLSLSNWDESVYKLEDTLKRAVRKSRQYVDADIDSDDPQKGRWGGEPARDGYRLSASVREVANEWFRIQMSVESEGNRSLKGTVEFHLHDSLRPDIVTIPARDNRAELTIGAYGGFTVGAVLNGGNTTLELDLCELNDAPDLFRQR
jgi:tetrahydromethanopterin S-methyltransferase subunit B